MSMPEADASNITNSLANPSGASVVYEGVVRGSHTADVGVFRVGDVVCLLTNNYRHNASCAVIGFANGEVDAVLSTSTGVVYTKNNGGSDWKKVEDDITASEQAGKFTDQKFIDSIKNGVRKPRGVVLPESIVDVVTRSSLRDAA